MSASSTTLAALRDALRLAQGRITQGGRNSASALEDKARVSLGHPAIDEALQGGLARGAVHLLTPAGMESLGTLTGFAFALAVRARATPARPLLYVQTGNAAQEAGLPYAPGHAQWGLKPGALILARLPRAEDVLWAMEEGLRAKGFAAVLGEMEGLSAASLDLTASRRLSLAAREGAGFGLILQHTDGQEAGAAHTRWRIASIPSPAPDPPGVGAPAMQIELTKNRSGPCGTWAAGWDHDTHIFTPLSGPLAAFSADRTDRAEPDRRARAGTASGNR